MSHWTDDEVEFIIGRYSRLGPKNLANQMNRGWVSIYCKARKLGLSVSKESKYDRNCVAPNVTQFTAKKTPESAYLLGLIWADGHLMRKSKTIRGNMVSLALKEEDLLEVKHIMLATSDGWRFYKKPTTVEGKLNSKELHSYLNEMGFSQKSTESPGRILSDIPSGLRSYFWRGYFDGDGHISAKPRANALIMTGHLNQNWDDFLELLNSLDVKGTYRFQSSAHGSCSRICFYKRSQILAFGNYIYSGKSLGLTRKRSQFEILGIE